MSGFDVFAFDGIEIICTIDPADAKDLDDALSVKAVGEGIYEIGVHIADVSHFVEPATPLDEDARLRTTSVYLVHKVKRRMKEENRRNIGFIN